MITFYHITTFFLSFFGYSALHSLRQGWSYSQTRIHNEIGVSEEYFGLIDTLYLAFYSLGLATIGNLSRYVPLKWFVSVGMILSALCYVSFALYYHFTGQFSYVMTAIFMCLNGFFQSTGWPGLIGIFRNWFGSTRNIGLLLGIWAINANIGNIIAELTCNIIENENITWTYGFIYTAFFTVVVALLIMLFLKNEPKNSQQQTQLDESVLSHEQQETIPIQKDKQKKEQKSFNVFQAIFIPKVPYYLVGYACLKGCIYGLLFWLPTFLVAKGLNSEKGYISAMLDVGSFIGGLIVGGIGDIKGYRALYLSPLLFFSSFMMFLVAFLLSNISWMYYVALLILGISVGGPYNIIGTVMAIDLGQQVGGKNVSIVSALIEGTAAAFAALSQILISFLPNDAIFYLFSVQSLIAGLVLMPMFLSDYRQRKKNKERQQKSENIENNQQQNIKQQL